MEKKCSLISPWTSSGESLSTGKLSSSWRQTQVFQNSNFHLKAWILSLATNTIIHLRKCLPNTQGRTSVPVVLSRIHGVPWKRWANSKTFTSAFPWDNHRLFQNEAEIFYIYFPFCHTEKRYVKDQDLVKIKIISASSRTLLSEIKLCFFSCESMVVKKTMTSPAWCNCLC